MLLTKRGLVLVGLGIIPLFIAGSVPLWFVYIFFLIGLLLFDLKISPKSDDILVERSYSQRFALAAENKITISLTNYSADSIDIQLKDDFPFDIQGERKTYRVKIGSGETAEVFYKLTPYKRGLYHFGAVNLRISTRLGLFYRQAKYCTKEQIVKVYPNLLVGNQEILKVQRGILQDQHIRSLFMASGTEFVGIREYVSGDEFRKINWNATARRGRMMINEFREDRSQPIYMIMDSGRMMTERVGYLSKLDHAINTSAILAYISIIRGEQVGYSAFSNKIHHFVNANKGKGQFQIILDQMYQLESSLVESDYRHFCQHFLSKQRRRSMICLFTDMVDSQASGEMVVNLSRLAKNHLVICVVLRDSELENKTRIIPENSKEVYEKGVASELMFSRMQAVAKLRSAGVVVIDETPEKITVATVNKYLELKARMV